MQPYTTQPYTTDPLNAGSSADALRDAAITPTDAFFVRNHAPAPVIDPDTFRLTIGGRVGSPLSLSLADLRDRFAAHTITAVLQCAGNRRRELVDHAPIDPAEIVWDIDALGCAVWSGVRLRDVLLAAGIGEGAAHVAFTGLDHVEKTGDVFGGSIPLAKASPPMCCWR